MKKFVIFYRTARLNDSVVIDAESLKDAYDVAVAFSRVHAVDVVGIFLESALLVYYPDE
nr:MAG TPA: hypothetical protein [Bacteriophage sp.]